MCGIAGIISIDPSLVSIHRVKEMSAALPHRGPGADADADDSGQSREIHVRPLEQLLEHRKAVGTPLDGLEIEAVGNQRQALKVPLRLFPVLFRKSEF